MDEDRATSRGGSGGKIQGRHPNERQDRPNRSAWRWSQRGTMDEQVTEEEREAALTPKANPSMVQGDPSATTCPKCGGVLTAKGECARCKIYLCRHCGNIQDNDHSLSWGQTFAFFFIFVGCVALYLLVSIVLAGGFGVALMYVAYHLAQAKCSKCGKRAF